MKMAGAEYFTFTPITAGTLPEKLNKRLMGPTYEYEIAKPVQEYLDEQLKRALLEK